MFLQKESPSEPNIYHYIIYSVMSSTVDVDGLRHVLLCRVILGRMEEVIRGSGQSQSSSKQFDTGVDNLQFPARYIIWYPHVNTRILPQYVLSIKVDFRSRGAHLDLVSFKLVCQER